MRNPFRFGASRAAEVVSERDPEDDLTDAQRDEILRRDLLARWRRTASPSLADVAGLRALLPQVMTREHFAVADVGEMSDIAAALDSDGSLSVVLRRHGLGLPYPRNDVVMSLVWLACGEGDVLARFWVVDALARRVVGKGGADSPRMLGLVREHFELIGLSRMTFSDGSVRGMLKSLTLGQVPRAARSELAERDKLVDAFLDGLLSMRMHPGWKERYTSSLTSIGTLAEREGARRQDRFLEEPSEFPVPYASPMPRGTDRGAGPHGGMKVRVTPHSFVADKGQRRFVALESPLPLRPVGDVAALEEALLREFPWMSGPVERIVSVLSLRSRGASPWFHFPPMLLVGPRGTGKTRFARRLSELAGVPLSRIMAAGRGGAVELLGHSPTYNHSHPSAPVSALVDHGVANPILLIDEIEKFGSSNYNGDPRDALVGMLEPETSRAFRDDNLRTEVDLGHVSFLCTANAVTGLPSPLLDRLAVFEIPRPGGDAFPAVFETVLSDTATYLGLDAGSMPVLPPETVARLRQAFQEGASIRRLKSAVLVALRTSMRIGLH